MNQLPTAIETGSFTDKRDGKTYKTVKIGSQIWMAENLNYEAEGSVCYDNNPENGEKYGRLYSWETATKVSPEGWHLPSDDEWNKLIEYVGGEEAAGKNLKAKFGWKLNCNGLDTYGFSALPGGSYGDDDDIAPAGYTCIWWSRSTSENDGCSLTIYYNYDGAYKYDCHKNYGFSIRCVKDN
jgi:uncharacterized protein (TIGR02145 family)